MKNIHTKIQMVFIKTKNLWIIKELRNFQTQKEIKIFSPLILLLSSRAINIKSGNFKIKIRPSSNPIIIKSLMSNRIKLFKLMCRISHMWTLRIQINMISIILFKIPYTKRHSVVSINSLAWQASILVELCPVEG